MMKMDFKHPLFGLLALTSVLGPPQSLAYPTAYSERSVAVVPDNAQNAACRKYSVGGIELKKKRPRSQGTVTGGGESANYDLSDSTNLGFSDASVPIDFVVVRGRRGKAKAIAIHYYTSKGVSEDDNIQVLDSKGDALPITEFALCAKSAETEGTPKLVTFDLTIPRCGASGTPTPSTCGGLTGKEIVLVKFTSLREDLTNSDPDGTPAAHTDPVDGRTCFCTGPDLSNVIDNLVQCDDSRFALDDDPGVGQKVRGDSCTAKIGAKVQEVTELENDPYFCRTINGRRICWSY